MGLDSKIYRNGILNLLQGDFENTAVGAQLLSNSYSYSAAHATLADVIGFGVGNSIQITGKTISLDSDFATVIDFDDITYSDQGTLQARWVVFHFGVGSTTDKLIYVIDLDDTAQDQEITPALKIAITGGIKIPFPTA